tara:strand:- start:1000 stop:1464 length:465 start_codon:yes stop_codon:yes gene_type:complete
MNFGFYISDLKKNEHSLNSFTPTISDAIKRGIIEDASVFFDVSGGNFPELKCGTFNSTDLSHFKGSLFFIEQDLIRRVVNSINKIDVYLGYGYGERDVLNILFLLSQDMKVKAICRSQKDVDDFHRITGVRPLGQAETPEQIIALMKEGSHEDK